MGSRPIKGKEHVNNRIERLCEELLHYDDMIFGWRETVQRTAEAIVLECIKMVENEAAQYAQPTWAVELVNDIKENFGIEREWTQESKDWVIKNFGIEP